MLFNLFRKKKLITLRRRKMIHQDFIIKFLKEKYKGQVVITESEDRTADVQIGDLSFEIKERALDDFLYRKTDILIETIQDTSRFIELAEYFTKTPLQYTKPNLKLLKRCLGWIYCEQADYLLYIKYNTEKNQQSVYIIDFPKLKKYFINTVSEAHKQKYEVKSNILSSSTDTSYNTVIPLHEIQQFTSVYFYEEEL